MRIHYNCLRGVNRQDECPAGPRHRRRSQHTTTCGGSQACSAPLNDCDRCPRPSSTAQTPCDSRQIENITTASGSEGARQDPARFCLVVQRPEDRHGEPDEEPGKPGPAGQLRGHAHRQPPSFWKALPATTARRICTAIGQWVEMASTPTTSSGEDRQGICFDNAKRYFAL